MSYLTTLPINMLLLYEFGDRLIQKGQDTGKGKINYVQKNLSNCKERNRQMAIENRINITTCFGLAR